MKLADKTYYLDENGKVTTDTEKAQTVLINEGQEILADIADQYPAVKAKSAKAEAKAEAPADNKSKAPAENKAK